MSRTTTNVQAENVERSSFVKGFITEASPLAFPEDATTDEQNFKLNTDGSRQRRLGIDFEADYVVRNTAFSGDVMKNNAISGFAWKNVNNDSTVGIAIVQVGTRLHFFDLLADSFSANVVNITVNLAPYGVSGTRTLQYAAVNGVVVIATGETDPLKLEYKNNAIVVSNIDLKVRDIWGLEEDIAIDTRPIDGQTTTEHKYNVANQGWHYPGPPASDILTGFRSNTGRYPSNADAPAYLRDSQGQLSPAYLATQKLLGTTPAPKGRFLLDAFDRGNSRRSQSGIDVPLERETGRPSCVASYAGRIFYSGIQGSVVNGDAKSPNFTGTVLFSQIAESTEKLSRCYQEADPTSEEISDLVSSDGGTVDIIAARNIVKMVAKDATLVVFAENGVWQITGPDGVFKADDYSITQVTNIGALSADSIIVTETALLYWADSGIIALQPDQVSGRLSAQNITEGTIQSFYRAIPTESKKKCVGHYDTVERTIRWLYYDGSTEYKNRYNKELVLDVTLSAFYKYSIGEIENGPYIAGFMPADNYVVTSTTELVTAGSAVTAGGENVTIVASALTDSVSKTKYITLLQSGSTWQIVFSAYRNLSFVDWGASGYEGLDAYAYMITGYETFQDTQRKKSVPYLTTHFKRTETGFADVNGDGSLELLNPSSCLVQAQWGWAKTSDGGKWGSRFQAYRPTRYYVPSGTIDKYTTGDLVLSTKHKLRGTGKAISLRMETEPFKNCHIYGWAFSVHGDSKV